MQIKVRHRWMMKASDPNEEPNFRSAQKTLSLDPAQTAFVLVDMWDASDLPREIWPGGVTFCERAAKITQQCIVPALDAARQAGMTIIHAPTVNVSERYPEHYRRTLELNAPEPPIAPVREWPPDAARQQWNREQWESRYADYSDKELRMLMDDTTIMSAVEPCKDDWLIGTSGQMHEICRREQITSLVYVGFATGMCLLFKPGAMWEMSRAGYRCICLRDCTTAVENADTYDELLITHAFIDWFEMMMVAYTALSDDFITACDDA